MTMRLPPGEELYGTNVLAESYWDEGPDTVDDVLAELGPFPGRDEAVAAIRHLMTQAQWSDFSQDLRDSVLAWLGNPEAQKIAVFLEGIVKGTPFPPPGYEDTPENSYLWHRMAQKVANLQAEDVEPTPGLVTPEE
jgi:hypothetical protein